MKYINNIDNNEMTKKFLIIQMTRDEICNKIYKLKSRYNIEKIFDTYKIDADECINNMNFTQKNNNKFKKIIEIIKNIKYKKNRKIIYDVDSFTKRDIEKLKNSDNIIDSDKVIIFVHSGALEYYLFLIENNKRYIIEKICKHYYSHFYKYKDQMKDLTRTRCLNNYDPICKMVCRYYHYMITNTALMNCNTNIVRSIVSRETKTAFSKIVNTIMYFKMRMIHFNDKIIIIDLSKAYDHVDRNILKQILTKFSIPIYIINYINYIFSVEENKTKTKNHLEYNKEIHYLLYYLTCIIIQYIKALNKKFQMLI